MNAIAANSTTLSNRAMLVTLSISQWGNRVFERDVTDRVATEGNAAREMISTTKRLMSKQALTGIGSAIAKARTHHYEQSLPWLDNGYRILPAANYLGYVEAARKLRADFYAAVDEFIAAYPEHLEEAKKRLNGLFNADDYPTPAELRSRFSLEFHIMPLPDASDFRVAIGDGDVERIKSEIEARVASAVETATKSLFERVVEAVTHLRDRLAAYEVTAEGKVKNPFRDSAVTHLRELCDLLPRLNLSGDADLESVRQKLLDTLCAAEPEDLRGDVAKRDEAVRTADDILRDMAGYCD